MGVQGLLRRFLAASFAAFVLGVGAATGFVVDNCAPKHHSSWISANAVTRVFEFHAWVSCDAGDGSCVWRDQIIVLRKNAQGDYVQAHNAAKLRNGVCGGPVAKNMQAWTAGSAGQFRAILNIQRENGTGVHSVTLDAKVN
jgi:hypothetical protein